MRAFLLLLAVTLTGCLTPMGVAAEESTVSIEDFREVSSHLISQPPVVRTPWVDLSMHSGGGEGWYFEITVNEDGGVTHAEPLSGPAAYRKEAIRAATALRFKPFQRDGQAVRARFNYRVLSRVGDYSGPSDRAFPLNPDPRLVRIALRRSACFGTCPDYGIELRGDGEVSYRGSREVLIEGEHHWQVSPAAVAQLVQRLRQADYFKLDGYYVFHATDLPTYITRLSIGRQQKFVLDYGGQEAKSFGLPAGSVEDPHMPGVVTELEDAIDQVSGATSWVEGDANTMARLRQANWNFGSEATGRGLALLIRDCKAGLAADFIRAGAPVRVSSGERRGSPAAASATRCGDLALIQLLESKGALARKEDVRAFLEASVASGFPDLVALALKHDSNVRLANVEGRPLISAAANAYRRDPRASSGATFDPAQVVVLLLAAGADPNARDLDGRTPLEIAQNEGAVLTLLAAGASLPTEPARLSKMVDKATQEQWTKVLPILERAAGTPKGGAVR